MRNLLINGLAIDWDRIAADSYLKNIEALQGLKEMSFRKPVTFFVGENGSGKSTLLEAVAAAWGFNPEGGTRNYSFSTYDSHSELCEAIRLSRGTRKAQNGYFLRAESFYNVATMEEEYSKGPGGRPQFIIVTHSPILLGLPDAEILSFDEGPVHPCGYEETDSYRITSMFINDRERILHQLLEDEDEQILT